MTVGLTGQFQATWWQQGAQPRLPSDPRPSATVPASPCVPVQHPGHPVPSAARLLPAAGLGACPHPFPGAARQGELGRTAFLRLRLLPEQTLSLRAHKSLPDVGKMVGQAEHMTGQKIARTCHSWPLLFHSLTLFLLFIVLSTMEGNIWTLVTANQICMHIAAN